MGHFQSMKRLLQPLERESIVVRKLVLIYLKVVVICFYFMTWKRLLMSSVNLSAYWITTTCRLSGMMTEMFNCTLSVTLFQISLLFGRCSDQISYFRLSSSAFMGLESLRYLAVVPISLSPNSIRRASRFPVRFSRWMARVRRRDSIP